VRGGVPDRCCVRMGRGEGIAALPLILAPSPFGAAGQPPGYGALGSPPASCHAHVRFPAHRGRRALRKTYADIFARHTRSGHGWSPARPERPCEPECGASAIHRQSCRVTRQLRRSLKQRTPRQFAQKIPPATINSIVDAVGRKAGGLIQSPRRRLQFCFTSSLLS
jgi:hypothetical protein